FGQIRRFINHMEDVYGCLEPVGQCNGQPKDFRAIFAQIGCVQYVFDVIRHGRLLAGKTINTTLRHVQCRKAGRSEENYFCSLAKALASISSNRASRVTWRCCHISLSSSRSSTRMVAPPFCIFSWMLSSLNISTNFSDRRARRSSGTPLRVMTPRRLTLESSTS